jgi:ABC-type phosphate transport system permease subunit
MEKILNSIKDNNSVVYGIIGVSILAGYLAFGKKIIEQQYHVNLRSEKNMLDANFE